MSPYERIFSTFLHVLNTVNEWSWYFGVCRICHWFVPCLWCMLILSGNDFYRKPWNSRATVTLFNDILGRTTTPPQYIRLGRTQTDVVYPLATWNWRKFVVIGANSYDFDDNHPTVCTKQNRTSRPPFSKICHVGRSHSHGIKKRYVGYIARQNEKKVVFGTLVKNWKPNQKRVKSLWVSKPKQKG